MILISNMLLLCIIIRLSTCLLCRPVISTGRGSDACLFGMFGLSSHLHRFDLLLHLLRSDSAPHLFQVSDSLLNAAYSVTVIF
jgi:hypothetical protein